MTSQYEPDLEPSEADPAGHDDLDGDELQDDQLADHAMETRPVQAEPAPPANAARQPLAMAPSVRWAESSLAPAPASPGSRPAEIESKPFAAGQLSEEWREIQASFVDDPRGAVQMAAETAEAALTTLVTSLRDRQATLGPTANQDTEQLRAALQAYRKFCYGVADAGRRLATG